MKFKIISCAISDDMRIGPQSSTLATKHEEFIVIKKVGLFLDIISLILVNSNKISREAKNNSCL